MRFKTFAAFLCILACARSVSAQPGNDFRLHFHEGDLHRVVIKEVLSLAMHFPQVQERDNRPSVRTSIYSFTERVDSLLPGGMAVIAATLDSFQTGIDIGEGKHAENFFRFNSSGDYDITHELHDIKVLPRAQFLGQTIRFVMRPDGTIAQFLNLQDFHDAAVGADYDYDLLHAILSLSDSLRMGQLLEYGFGGIAAANGPYTSQTTTTEIPVTRTVSTKHSGAETLDVHVRYYDAPKRIEYLEGIAMPLGILHYEGGGTGSVTLSKGYLKHSFYQDTAKVLLDVDIDTVPEEIIRTVTTDVYPISVRYGRIVSLKELQTHSGVNTDSLRNVLNQRGELPHTSDERRKTPPAQPDASPADNDSATAPR